jgi:hypothetical protein
MSLTEKYSDCVKPVMLTGDTTYQSPRMDSATHNLIFIDAGHHEIHDGSSFTSTYTDDKSIGTIMDILIVTPNTTKWAHLIWTIEGESELDISLYRGATASNNGTPLIVSNRNDNSANTPTTVCYHTPTVDSGSEGTLYRVWHTGSGKASGGGTRSDTERILQQNTKYLFRITATAAGWIAIKLDWYEHSSKTA